MAEFGSLDGALESLREHELRSNNRYAAYKTTKDFGTCSLDTAKRVYWEDQPSVQTTRIEFSGVPFVVLGQKVFDCQFGKNRKAKRRARKQMDKKVHKFTKGSKFPLQDTKKMDCPARCVFRDICRFPSYKIQADTSNFKRKRLAEDILTRIRLGDDLSSERVILTHICDVSEHTCQALGEFKPDPLDPRLARKIEDLCHSGVNSLHTMRTLLKSYVRDICNPPPHPSSKRFFPNDKCIYNHMYKANKRRHKEDQQVLTDLTHPSVRIKGTETNYAPVQCFDPVCADKAPHMHCPFCVKTESYTDPVILKAHYRVKHVDKGIEFAGLKVLRCCDRCDIVGVIKGEKKFKGAHWHCYKCRNGFNRRDEAIKHYKTHFRNPQTTFQIQIAQDINQPVSQGFESEEAAACIHTDSFSVSAGLTECVSSQSGGLTLLGRSLDGMVSMPGVGAVETVGVTDTQTIMIIQDDGSGNLGVQELCSTQDADPPDLTISDDIEDSSHDTVQELREKVAQLEKEKAEQEAHITLLSKKIEEQAEQIAAYKVREQGLVEQMHQLQQGLSVPQDRAIQDLCNQLETQHKQLIRQQITQLKHSLVTTPVPQPKMLVLNTNTLGGQLGQTVNLQAFNTNNSATQVAVAIDFNDTDENEVDSSQIQTEISEVDTTDTVDVGKGTDEIENDNVKDDNFVKETEYSEILVQSLPDELGGENPIIENDGSICDEPEAKRRKEK